jgi:hypothetical protein
MGQQQLLLLVLSAIIVGVSIVVGINMFSTNAYQANRENVIQEAVNIGAKAQQWYRKPATLGGGGRSFSVLTTSNMEVLGVPSQTINGEYQIDGSAGTSLTITATGNEADAGGDTLSFTIDVFPDSVGNPTITSGT